MENALGKDVEEMKCQLKEMLKRSNVIRIIVEKDNKTIMNIPLTVGVVGLALGPLVTLVGLSAAVIGKFNIKVENEEDVNRNWEKIKLKEGKKSVLEGVPKSLPALVKAARIQEKVAGVGFDWDCKDDVFAKIKEELDELHAEVENQDKDETEKELGDVLFSIINYARFLKINPENALERTNKKFIQRFQYLEKEAEKRQKSLKDMTLSEMESFWQEAKKYD